MGSQSLKKSHLRKLAIHTAYIPNTNIIYVYMCNILPSRGGHIIVTMYQQNHGELNIVGSDRDK